MGNLVLFCGLKCAFKGTNVLTVMAVNKFDGLAAVSGTAAAQSYEAVKFAGGQHFSTSHDFMVFRIGSGFIKQLGCHTGSFQNALDCLYDTGTAKTGSDDQGISHAKCFGIIANHRVRTPTDIYGRIGVLHFDRIFGSLLGKCPF